MTKKYLRAVHTRFSRRKAVQALGALLITAIALLVLFPLAGAWRQWSQTRKQSTPIPASNP